MQDDPTTILKKRLAMGEISIDQFNELLALLADDNRQKASTSTFNNPPHHDKAIISIDADNWFGNVTFSHKANTYRMDEIIALKSGRFTQTINFAPSHYSGFELTLLNGNVLKYKATSVIVKTKKASRLAEALDFVSKLTFAQRVQQYIGPTREKGFFQYHDYIIYENGDIKHKGKCVNIAEASLQSGVEFGRKSSFGLNSYYTPDEIWVFQKIQDKFLKKHICIKIKENRDVIYAILIKLAELKGGKVTFARR
jgi:hypothetical protein